MNREKLLNVLERVKPGLAAKDIVEHSTSFIFTGKVVMTYNDEVSANIPIKTDFKGAVPADPLLAFLKKATGEEVELEQGDGELLLSCGKSTAGIPLHIDIPDHLETLKWPKKGWEPLPENFESAIRFCSFSASNDMTKGVITNLHIKRDRIESTDQNRATRVELEGEVSDKSILLPALAARHLPGNGLTKWAVKDGWAHFSHDNPDAIHISCRLSHGEYPDLDSAFEPKEGKATNFPKKLKEALDRAGAFAISDFDNDRRVDIKCKKGKMIVRAEGPTGWFKETMKTKMPDVVFSVHPDFLNDILAHSRKAQIQDKLILFQGKGFEHVTVIRKK